MDPMLTLLSFWALEKWQLTDFERQFYGNQVVKVLLNVDSCHKSKCIFLVGVLNDVEHKLIAIGGAANRLQLMSKLPYTVSTRRWKNHCNQSARKIIACCTLMSMEAAHLPSYEHKKRSLKIGEILTGISIDWTRRREF